jgi:predicted flap endonuclease-1-like 5' DNA nuclease
MRVKVIEPGVYNGPGHRALRSAQAGDEITVASHDYAQSLEASGFVEILAGRDKDKKPYAPPNLTRLDGPPTAVERPVAAPVGMVKQIERRPESQPPDASDGGNNGDSGLTPKPADFSKLRGVGKARAAELQAKGFVTFADLANADPERLHLLMEVSRNQIDAWIKQAGELAQAAENGEG